jgi:hypothetical protein
MKAFIAALALLALAAAVSSFISLPDQRPAGQAGYGIVQGYPSDGWDLAGR